MTNYKKPHDLSIKKSSLVASLLVLFLLNPISLMAKNYLSLSSQKNGKTYKNSVTVIDLDQNTEITKIDLGKSYKLPGNFIQTRDLKNIYYYHQVSKQEAMIKVFDAKTFSLKYSAKIGHLDYVLLADYEVKTFFDVSPDASKLYIQTNQKKVRNIMVFDNNSGELLKQIPLIKTKSYSFLSDDSDYLLTLYTSKHILSIHDANSFIKIKDVALKSTTPAIKISKYGEIYQDYLFISAKANYRNKKNTYKIKTLNLKTKEEKTSEYITNGKPIYVKDNSNNKLYIAAKNIKNNQLILLEFLEGNLTRIDTNEFKLYPKDIIFNEGSEKLLIIGKKDNLLLDRENPKDSILMDQPFDTANIIWKPSKKRLFLREGSGSEVAAFDTLTGEKIDRSGTGRPGVKFGQFLASAAFTAVGYGYGYIAYAYKLSSTDMMLNVNQDKLYVINSKTNDVTQFNANDLSGRKALATGGGTAFMYQHEDNSDSFFVLSNKKANIISDKDFSMIKQLKFDEVLGLDFDASLLFIKEDDTIKAMSMIDGSFLPNLPLGPNAKSIVPLIVD